MERKRGKKTGLTLASCHVMLLLACAVSFLGLECPPHPALPSSPLHTEVLVTLSFWGPVSLPSDALLHREPKVFALGPYNVLFILYYSNYRMLQRHACLSSSLDFTRLETRTLFYPCTHVYSAWYRAGVE